MYNLEGGVAWTDELKNAFKTGTTYCSVIHNQQNYNESNYLKEAELKDIRYVPSAGFIGQAVSRMLTIKMVNNENSNLNFENADVQFKIGAEYNNVIYYINYGNFIVNEPPKNDATNGTVSFVAYDYMIKFNKDYINRVTYPCTLKDLLLDICSQAGVTLGTTDFPNQNFIVEDNQFEGKQLREVLQHIAKNAFSWARIGQDNRLYLDFSVSNNHVERITIDDYKADSFKKANEYYGPINKVTFADSDIKGQEESVQDNASIQANGLTEIIIYDNYFGYTTEKRHELIQAGTALFGLRYMPIQSLDLIGLVYLDSNDTIEVEDLDSNIFTSRNFSHTISYNGIVSDKIETIGESINEKEYSNANNSIAQNARVEVIVDRANKKITQVIEEVDGQNKKISTVEQTLDELRSQISDISEITESQETITGTLSFENINQSEPIRIVIHPTGVNIAKLHPHTNLKPRAGLKMTTRILRFTNTTTNEVFNYEIPDDLLYYDNENYDEFILNYEGLSCQINKKCKWNNDGTVGLLANPRTDEYEFPHIELTDGDYTVQVIQYANAYLFARLMVQNYYTTQFATKAEVDSEISQTVNNINLSVNKKLTNYSTTTEMNSAIDIKANQITQSVSETYATQSALGKTEESFNTKIQQTARAITQSVSETYVTNQTLQDNYSTTQQTSGMISATVSSMTKKNLETVTVEYALGTDTETAPSSGWSTTAPPWQQGKYMWQRTKTKTADGTEKISEPTCIAGAKGQDGTNGKDGTNGVSVSSITEYYAVSSSNSSAPADTAFKTTLQTMTATNKYLWNYEIITYSNGSTQPTTKRVIGVYGDKGTNGTNGIGITSVTNKYQVSNNNSTAPTTWKDTPQTMTATNKYLWNYEIITYSNGTSDTSKPAVIGTYGEKGDKGNTGDTGKGVKAVVAQYYLSSSNEQQKGGEWKETQPPYKTNYYYWTRTKITWTDNTTTYTVPILVEEINSLNESVASLNIRAGNIESTVRTKVGNDEIISKINQSAEAVQINANKISLNGKAINLTSGNITISSDKFSVDKNGNITATGGNIGGFTMDNVSFSKNLNGIYNYNLFDIFIVVAILMDWISLPDNFKNLSDINSSGKIDSADMYWIAKNAIGEYESPKNVTGTFTINSTDPKNCISVTKDGETAVSIGVGGINTYSLITSSLICGAMDTASTSSFQGIVMDGETATLRIKQRGDPNVQASITYNQINLTNEIDGEEKIKITTKYIEFDDSLSRSGLVYYGSVLYNNSSGSTGTITLAEDASNYDFLEIFYSKGGIYQSVKVYSPNNKKVSLLVGYLNSSSEAQLQLAKVTISGTQITRDTGGYINFQTSTHYMGVSTEVGIHRVVGYRSGYPN